MFFNTFNQSQAFQRKPLNFFRLVICLGVALLGGCAPSGQDGQSENLLFRTGTNTLQIYNKRKQQYQDIFSAFHGFHSGHFGGYL